MRYIKKAYERRKNKGWPKLYICVDMHETVVTPTYTRLNEGAVLYPGAAEVLQRWTQQPHICLIMWSPLYDDARASLEAIMAANDIKFDYFNSNPENPSGDLCCFDKKWYFDIVLEDKGGFEADVDWFRIKETLIEIGEW